MTPGKKQAFEPTGLIPRSIVRTFERFYKQLLPRTKYSAIREYRISRYQVLVSIRCLCTLLILPLVTRVVTNWLIFSYALPQIKYFWDVTYQDEHIFSEIDQFSQVLFFDSLLDTAPTPVIYPKNDGKKMSFERVCKDKVLYSSSRNDISYSKNLSRFIFFENPRDEVKNTFDFTPFACPEGIGRQSSDRVSFNKASARIFDSSPLLPCLPPTLPPSVPPSGVQVITEGDRVRTIFNSSSKILDLSESLPYVSIYPSPPLYAISFTPGCTFACPSPLSLCPSCPEGVCTGTELHFPFNSLFTPYFTHYPKGAQVLSFASPVTFGDGIGSTGTYGHKGMSVGDNEPLLPSKSKAKTDKEGVSMQGIPLSYLRYSVLSPMPFLPVPEGHRGMHAITPVAYVPVLSPISFPFEDGEVLYSIPEGKGVKEGHRCKDKMACKGIESKKEVNKKGNNYLRYVQDQALQNKIFELAESSHLHALQSVTNVFADFFSILVLIFLLITLKPEITILKSFLVEVIYNLSDTTKSFLLILMTDLLVGFHSPRGWETMFSLILHHFGLPENQDFVFLFVATLPVILDTVFKYWIFRHLNKISPSTVATYHNMIE